MTRREKLIVAAVPSGIVLIAVWMLWLSPRLALHGIVEGEWSDFSGAQHRRVGEETVISFRARSHEALQDLIARLEFSRGVPGGNMAEIAESTLRSAGYDPNRFTKYFTSEPWFMFLYVDSNQCVLVRINL